MGGRHDMAQTGPETIAGRFLRSFWQPIATAGMAPGRARPVEIMGEKFTLYRGDGGTFHLTDFHCAHRRAQLSVGWVEGDSIRCRYHGWRYDANGQCVEQPAESARDAFCAKIKLRAHLVQEYHGLLFAYLGEGEPPELPRYPQLEGEGLLDSLTYGRNSNYLNNLENNLDSVHVNFVHHFHHHFEPMQVEVRPMPWGASSHAKMPGENFIRVAHFVMPNILIIRLPMEDLVPGGIFPEGFADVALWRVPRDDHHHQTFGITRVVLPAADQERYTSLMKARRAAGPPPLGALTARVLSGETTLEEAEASLSTDHSAFKPFLEDSVIQEGQGLTRPELEHLGKTDQGTATIRKLWQRELSGLSSGKPLSKWTIPGPLHSETIAFADS
jgi:5,5'-dehydrodivanillate O-demethylase